AVDVLREGRSVLTRVIAEETLDAASHDDEHTRLIREVGIHSSAIVPLVTRGRVIGALTLASSDPARSYDDEDLRLAEDLALRASLAVENARLLEERTEQSRTLQRALLPPDLPAVPGLDAAALYLPAAEGVEVGGDFYDLFNIDADTWGAVVGDVCGKGVEAAVLTALCRHTIRTAAGEGNDPSAVLRILNRAILRETAESTFATVCYMALTMGDDSVHVELASGGHPLPLVVRGDGTVEVMGETRGVLGFFEVTGVGSSSFSLHRGDTLVAYTDGVTDARRGDEFFGEARLSRVVGSCGGLPSGSTVERIAKEVTAFEPGGQRDDIVLLALRVTADGAHA
ncbi:MAG TPA: GAF domain-containing SpoIIE family protein phosphatase, partial [Actinomycetota bacterium]|nr:GAF domain-containing SpoIIE family protein phosphatase [Actinomycetota bacterium]